MLSEGGLPRTLPCDYKGRLADYLKLEAHDQIKSDLETSGLALGGEGGVDLRIQVWLLGGKWILVQIHKYGFFTKNLRNDGGNLPVKLQ